MVVKKSKRKKFRICVGGTSMEYRINRKRQVVKRRLLRALVIATVYAGLMVGAVTVLLGSLWLIQNTAYGWCAMLMICMLVGAWMFFRLSQEEVEQRRLQCS